MTITSAQAGPARRWLRLTIAVGLFGTLLAAPHPAGVSSSAATPELATPNIVFIVTDDQRWDTLWAMPAVQSELVSQGVNFTNAFVVNSLCCPSRATFLTGQYSHSTLMYDNAGPYGGFSRFMDESTIATWLDAAGYRTSLMGKYFNGYNVNYIPPGWDHWVAFQGASHGGAYYDYDLNKNGEIVHYGRDPGDYSTDVLAGEADAFIRATDPADPLFLYLSFKAPHHPSTPSEEYRGDFSDLPPYRPPNYNEDDVSDKPAWVQGLPQFPAEKQAKMDTSLRKQYETFLSVDDAVQQVVTALSDTGRLSDTMIVYSSDHGWSMGEHRWNNKKVAYEESIRVPMIVRYDALITAPREDPSLIANIDLAPTWAELAGATAPGAEGLSFLPLLDSPGAPWRTRFLIEHLQGARDEVPTFCAVRSQSFTYVMYDTREEELYDLAADVWQLDNVATDPGYGSTLRQHRNWMKQLCEPPPPGFDP
jgi:N-acetylglucosamine-6-sulfatase